jgi:hypothetical protein
MKREVIFLFVFIFALIFIPLIYADELQQVEDAYDCLSTRVNQTGCSSLSFDDRVFTALASQECMSELSADNSSNQCWPKSGCRIKSTAQAILALNKKTDTTKAESWLLSQTSVPSGLEWFLEIESNKATTCDITYSGSTYKISIGDNKKISSTNLGRDLVLAQDNYWLKISPSIYNKEIGIKCADGFITTLLFKKADYPTVHVSDTVHYAGATGETYEKVESLCFAQGGTCNYEGSLWAAIVLHSLDKDDELKPFLPYLITMKDEFQNQIYLPEAFLYILTGKFRIELLLKQRANSYWSESGSIYYDTALALLPFGSSDSPTERENSKDWLLSVQQRSGCWNNGNIRDTAFVLYSIWPKYSSPITPVGECDYDFQCIDVSCKVASCGDDGYCSYEDYSCDDNDGCCAPGCDYSNDNDCASIECENDGQCPDDDSSALYCANDNVYQEIYTYSCNTADNMCETNTEEELVESCDNGCDGGVCTGGSECDNWFNRCPTGQKCESGVCIPDGGDCPNGDSDCPGTEYGGTYCSDDMTVYEGVFTYSCNTAEGICIKQEEQQEVESCNEGEKCKDGACITEGNDCSIINWCNSGYHCENKVCVPDGECQVNDDCSEEACQDASCELGSCLYEYFGCYNNDYCCNPGCDSSNDNDCGTGPECTTDAQCSDRNYEDQKYCGGDSSSDVYINVYTYTCGSDGNCVENLTEKLVEECVNQDCYGGECFGTVVGCESNDECDYPNEICVAGECVDNVEPPCVDEYDCNYENCVDGVCVPYDCNVDSDCFYGTCVNGKCIADEVLDCESEGDGHCTLQSNCDNSGGIILENYFCDGDFFECCSVEPTLNTCENEYGTICTYEETCLGTPVDVSDNLDSGEVCCVGGECQIVESTDSCEENSGTCRDTCDANEEEKSYTCGSGEVCCLEKIVPNKKSRGWILIVLLLVLIILAALGIVFRDKLRTQWIKIKDKLGGKKEKKRFEMPLTMHPNPQGRILPRRILPPGQSPTQQPPQSRFPFRGAVSSSTPATTPGISRPPQPSQPTQPAKPATPSTTTTQQPPKKPEEKPKNSELDDVLKKLKDMGNK